MVVNGLLQWVALLLDVAKPYMVDVLEFLDLVELV
jgi:hypothetical protein